MKKLSFTKKQHFVPCFYLKNFADKSGYLHVLNMKEMRLAKSRPYQGLGYKYYFYAKKTGIPDNLSQDVEEWLKNLENVIAKELPRVISKIFLNQPIKDDDRLILSFLISMVWLRAPGIRKQLNESKNNSLEQISKLYGQEIANKFKSTNNISSLMLLVNSTELAANILFDMKWKIYIARGKEIFVTSDSPVVEKWLPSKLPLGTTLMDRDKYFSLTPKIMIKLTSPIKSKKIYRQTLDDDNDDIVKKLNIIISNGSDEFVYSANKICLNQLLDGRKNPGKIEKEYIEKFIIPWKKYRMNLKK